MRASSLATILRRWRGRGPEWPEPETGRLPRVRRRRVLTLAVAGWGAFVLVAFVNAQRELLEPTLHLATLVALCALTFYSFSFLGWRLRRRVRAFSPPLDALESGLVELALGVAIVIAVLFAAGVLGLYRRETAWALLLVSLAGRHGPFLREVRRRWQELRAGLGPSLLWGALLVAGVATGFASLAPATSQDALVYHLAVPARFIEAGRLHYVEGNFYSAFPMNVEMLFTYGLLLEGDSLAKWFHWMLGAASVLAVAAVAGHLACRSGRWRARPCPLLAAALYGTAPTVALLAGWAYVDLAVVFFSTLSLLMLLHFQSAQRSRRVEGLRHPSTPYLILSALMAGLAAGCKYTGGIQAVLVAGAVLWLGIEERRSWRTLARQIAVTAMVVATCAAPWLVKNVVITGNPLFPFAYSIFGGESWDAERASVLAASLAEWGGGRTGLEFFTLPWKVSVEGRFFSQENFDGVIGCGFLIGAPLILFGWRFPAYRLTLAVFAGHGLFWMLTTHQVRFLLPAVAVAAALISVAVVVLESVWQRRTVLAALQLSILLNVTFILVHHGTHNPLPVVLGFESEDSYLNREVPGGDYAVFRYIDERLPEDSRILFGSCGNPGFLCKRSYRSDALFENFTLSRFLEDSAGPADLHGRLVAQGFTHLLFRFDQVFDPSGRRSEIPLDGQEEFADYLNAYARLEYRVGPTFLYTLNGSAPDPMQGE